MIGWIASGWIGWIASQAPTSDSWAVVRCASHSADEIGGWDSFSGGWLTTARFGDAESVSGSSNHTWVEE